MQPSNSIITPDRVTSLKHGLAQAAVNAVKAFYPPVCVHCHARIDAQSLWLCGKCYDELTFIPEQHCDKCGYPTLEGGCSNCAENSWVFTKAVSVFFYDKAAKSMVHGLKYTGFTRIADWFANQMFKVIGSEAYLQEIDLVTAVPLHPVRQRERGFNQGELIAIALAEQLGKPYTGKALRRNYNTESQTLLNSAARRRNLAGAFSSGKFNPAGKSLLLIDDVFTTGSTVNEAAKVLLKAGAQQVYVLTACHGV